MIFELNPGNLSYVDIDHLIADSSIKLRLSEDCYENIFASEKTVTDIVLANKTVYGINTGFGSLANTRISVDDLQLLQKKLVLSHAAGVGEFFPDEIVRLILLLKINSLARGFSGVRLQTIDALISLFNANIYPCIPSQGSVGASGDLAPLAHLSLILLGKGEARLENKIISAEKALELIELEPMELMAKEGLALLNGTQF